MKKRTLKIALFLSLACLPFETAAGYANKMEGCAGQSSDKTFINNLTTINDSIKRDQRRLYMIRVLARAKGDSVILRWAPDDFVSWTFGNQWGYNIYRMNHEGDIDTLASGLRPMSLVQMQKRFAPSDSLAGAAAQLIYGKGTALDSVGTEGSDGILRVYDEQQTRYAYAMLLAEIRPELAEAMALKWVDHQVRKGETYKYVVGSAIPDTLLRIGTEPITVKNVPYKAPAYHPAITDSMGINSVLLRWPMSRVYSTHDIERRFNGGDWVKLNNNPHITLTTGNSFAAEENLYDDLALEAGTYEYRVRGYDTFGDASTYSDIHKVELPDLIAPQAPLVRRFVIDRKEDGKIFADIIWKKTQFEEDFVGYNVYYYNKELSPDWEQLNSETLSKKDTLFRYDITGMGTGLVTVTAVDTAGNFSPSTPHELHVADLVPPAAPTGLHYVMSPSGNVIITWNKNKERDVASYELFSANDTTHIFTPLAGKLTSDTVAFDTLQVRGINQKFLYYAVRAYDFSGNSSPLSAPLQVLRKNYTPPAPCRPDSSWMTDETVNMLWFASGAADVDSFYVYRRLEGNQISDLIQVLPVDSVRNGRLLVSDRPQRNMTKRYYYSIQTTNLTGISSELSFEMPFLFKGATVLPIRLSLDGVYRADEKRIILGWKVDDLNQDIRNNGYFCVYRKKKDDEFFRFIESVSIDRRTTTDREIPAGESAEYEIRIRTDDGRFSPLSNRIKVEHPAPGNKESMGNIKH